MRKNSSGFYTLYVVMSLLVAPVLRLLSVFFVSKAFAAVYILLAVAAVCAITLESLKVKKYANAFEFNNPFHLDTFSYIASAGFFLNFVMQCILLYSGLKNGEANITYILPLIMSGLCALISSGYYIIIAFSFGSRNYDFREFRLIHVVPMLWAISCVFNFIELTTGIEMKIDSVLKYLMIISVVCFFYCFAVEVDKSGDARRSTVLFARLYSYFSVLYFVDRLILVLSNHSVIFCAENGIAVTGIMLCGFTFFFEKNILHGYVNKN